MTCTGTAAQNGVTFDDLGLLRDAAMLVRGGTVAALGRERDVIAQAPEDAVEIAVRDCAVVPGFVDAHAHPLFAGDREPDFSARTRGAQAGQGMLYTVERTREALRDPAGFYERTVRPRLQAMFAHGTTTLETKTGYALTKEGEFALLDLIAAHKDDAGVPRLVATFLGAHALAPEFDSYSAYVDYLVRECIPGVREHGAEYADVFCEPGFFSVDDSRRYLRAAAHHGLRLRAHCDEMENGGAVAMAADVGVDSFDHCNDIDEAGVIAIVKSGGVLVACPATIEFLGLKERAPVRDVLARGGTVALASDFNPGTSPCFNLQTVAYYGRKSFGLSAAEALYGVTVAANASLRADAGRLREGGPADFVALQIDDLREFGWQFGGNLAKSVCKAGRPVPRLRPSSMAYARDDKSG
ncbi:MAG: amidohydrolase family protein [Candidatus Tyrphobacter sp.]